MPLRPLHLALTALISLSISSHTFAYDAPKAKKAPVIDGVADDPAWANAPWRPMDKLSAGKLPESPQDFSGQFKVVWTPQRVYILAEITDDILMDARLDPLDQYWNDDTLELFIDEDKSGGNHQFNYNAFAYHIGLDNQTVDIGPSPDPEKVNFRLFNHHVKSAWRRSSAPPFNVIWEVALDVYPSTYQDSYAPKEKPVKPVKLKAGKIMGFMAAYCDNDASPSRETFMVSEEVPAVNGDKNRGFIDAGVFGELKLVE